VLQHGGEQEENGRRVGVAWVQLLACLTGRQQKSVSCHEGAVVQGPAEWVQ
jgi:hypothetical protein